MSTLKSTLKEAFDLLRDFSSLSEARQQKCITKIGHLLRSAEKKKRSAMLAIRDVDQLRKQRAYMLITAGHVDEGIKEISSLVNDYDAAIERLHDESAFQLAEGAIALFRVKRRSKGTAFARSALKHAGMAKSVNRTLLMALELMQRAQEKQNQKRPQGTEPSSELSNNVL